MHLVIILETCTRARALIVLYKHHTKMKVVIQVHTDTAITHMIHKLEHPNGIKY